MQQQNSFVLLWREIKREFSRNINKKRRYGQQNLLKDCQIWGEKTMITKKITLIDKSFHLNNKEWRKSSGKFEYLFHRDCWVRQSTSYDNNEDPIS